jgi:transcription initiation factor TFIIIB Brf1 subunit/transcription initiation factor TFIIB
MLCGLRGAQKERASTGQIALVTIRNYYKAIKLLCDMNELLLGWKKITRGLPKQIHASNDRPPIEEIKKLIEFPTED